MVEQQQEGPEKVHIDTTDQEADDNLSETLDNFRQRMAPYQRYIMIVGLIILILLVVYLGYAMGGLKVCRDLDGLLDSKFKCHPDFKPTPIYDERQTVIDYTNILIEDGGGLDG